MSSYLSRGVCATLVPDAGACQPGDLAAGAPGGPCPPWVIAAGAGDLADPSGGREDGALVAAGRAGPAKSGQVMTFAVPVATVPVTVRRSGAVQADGWLPDQVRLGLLETVLGDGVIEELCDQAVAAGLARPSRRRLMSLPFIMRVVVAMTLLPDADYPEVMRVLAGLLPHLPWARRWQVPTHKTVTKWRRRLGTWPLEQLFWQVAGPLVPDGAPGSVMIAGRPLCSMDGFEVDVPATPGNLAVFRCTGVSKDARWDRQGGMGQGKKSQAGKGEGNPAATAGSFPHLRCLLVTARAGRAMLGAAADTTDAGEQSLVARLVRDHPGLFAGRVFLMDRNFLGYDLITAILDAGGHLIMRVKTGISLPLTEDGWLPDGSRRTYLDEPDRHRVADRLPLRVAEHNVVLPSSASGKVSETYTIATTLLDHEAADAGALCAAYPMRWSASETTIGENKTTVTGAGPATTPCLRSGEPGLLWQELWAWLAATHLVRASAAAAVATSAAAAVSVRRQAGPGGADQVSFTTMRRAAIASMRQSLVTATTSLTALAALADSAGQAALHVLTVTGRQRYSERKQKSRPAFGHTAVTKTTHTGPVKITRFQPACTVM